MLVWMSHSLQENCSQRGKQWGREEMGEFDIHVTRLRAARAGYTLSDTLHHWQGSKTRIGDRESGSPIKTLRNWRMPDPGGKLEEIRGHYRARVFKSSCDGWMMILTPRKPSVLIPRKSLEDHPENLSANTNKVDSTATIRTSSTVIHAGSGEMNYIRATRTSSQVGRNCWERAEWCDGWARQIRSYGNAVAIDIRCKELERFGYRPT